MRRPIIGVDLDGTIAEYDGWQGEDYVGPLKPGAKTFLETLVSLGYDIHIFTARATTELGRTVVWCWVHANGLTDLIKDVTATKHYYFHRFVDDRGLSFRGDFNEILAQLAA